MSRAEAQSLSGKRAQVEFHKFASLGDFERVIQDYAEENLRRRGILVKHRDFIGPLSPFLEIGANAGHTSYMLANDFGADGFALDLSADALRYGAVLKDVWGLPRRRMSTGSQRARGPWRGSGCSFSRLACQTPRSTSWKSTPPPSGKARRTSANSPST